MKTAEDSSTDFEENARLNAALDVIGALSVLTRVLTHCGLAEALPSPVAVNHSRKNLADTGPISRSSIGKGGDSGAGRVPLVLSRNNALS
ncbi:hypothetical protein [Pararobbsia silviterrae]|uniref:Uncharacterized protein n=1 Tax=Pararobbsia silviterrae TaxID=1792498 RepID=A0A494X5Z2_9BURK|nr:hypothetical protein [Pararobbsia silviterrae]RKP43656.1 hypothetical protein D7S86_28640 [Pararobbsia silviterrae]